MGKYEKVKNPKTRPDMAECLHIIGKMRKATAPFEKDFRHMYALEMALKAMEAQEGRAMFIRMLRYHVTHEFAYIFPDALTHEMLEAAEKALGRQMAAERKRENAVD